MTIDKVRKLLRDAGVEYYIKKEKGCIVKIHVLVEEEKDAAST